MVYFGASTDKPQKIRKFAESLELDYPLLSDAGKQVAKAYGVLKIGLFAARHTFYIDAEGNITHVDRNVSPDTAGQDLVARLEALSITKL